MRSSLLQEQQHLFPRQVVSEEPAVKLQLPKSESDGLKISFWRTLASLLRFLRPASALYLVGLAILETLLVAQVGRVTGAYYRILLDKQWSAFWRVTGQTALLYTVATAVRSSSIWLSEYLALRWRAALTGQLQQDYLRGDTHFRLDKVCDNPDQRMVQDVALFCSNLADATRKLAATPFKIVYYSIWMGSITSAGPLGIVYAFFLLGACMQRWIMRPIIGLVCRQELLEGDLRYAHMRVRAHSEQVALWSGNRPEQAHLQQRLDAAVGNQLRLVMWRWLLSATTIALDYAGAVLNFCCVALPIAAGAFGEPGDTGKTAQMISNASFATLSLIYSFTEVLDLSNQLSTLAGLTVRVGQLQQALRISDKAAPEGLNADARLQDSLLDLQPGQDEVVAASKQAAWADGLTVHMSICRLRPRMRQMAQASNPDCPRHTELLAVCTMQAPLSALLPQETSSLYQADIEEMDRMLACFMSWQAAVADACSEQGFWCDAIDPRTGLCMRGRTGQPWNEVKAAHALLGYPVNDQGPCMLLHHPDFGWAAYPATLFTTAPLPALQAAISQAGTCWNTESLQSASRAPCLSKHSTVEDGELTRMVSGHDRQAPLWMPAPPSTSAGSDEPILRAEGLTCMTGQGKLVVRDLALQLMPGEAALLVGPSGVGKSTLVRALRGLWPLTARLLQMPPPSQVVFVPQLAIPAPGSSLREQLSYPSMHAAPEERLLSLVCTVQLEHLLDRVSGDFDRPNDWAGQLSAGELQRLAIARVLHAQPRLVVLDEGISAVGEEQARALIQALQASGIAVLATGQLDCQSMALFKKGVTLSGDTLGSWS